MQCCNRITTSSTYQCGIIITAGSNSLSIPCIRQLSLADSDGLLTGYIWINDKMQCSDRITTSSTSQCCIIIAGRCDILIVPGIRQLSLADGDGLLTGYIWINNKMKRRHRITTGSTNQCCIIIAGRCDILIVPCIRQLSLADCDGLLTGYIRINDKMQCSDRITTGSTNQCCIIIARPCNVLSIPCIRQLPLADG